MWLLPLSVTLWGLPCCTTGGYLVPQAQLGRKAGTQHAALVPFFFFFWLSNIPLRVCAALAYLSTSCWLLPCTSLSEDMFSFPLDRHLGVKSLDNVVNLCLIFLKTFPNFFPEWLHYLRSHQPCMRYSVFPYPHQHLLKHPSDSEIFFSLCLSCPSFFFFF